MPLDNQILIWVNFQSFHGSVLGIMPVKGLAPECKIISDLKYQLHLHCIDFLPYEYDR
jgi:hypothetical protein